MISRRTLIASGAACALPLPAFADERLILSGSMQQGSLIVGRTLPAATATFDGESLRVSPAGLFACGLAWDRTATAHVAVRLPDGTTQMRDVVPVARTYNVQHINGLPPKTVKPAPDDLERIKREHARIAEARKADTEHPWFAEPFDWPAPGIMSGVFGNQRIDNGVPMAPHMGVDMANVEGTPIHAPADGIVLLTDDFFLEGGFTMLDHGHGVSTMYMHQSKRSVSEGDPVKRGQPIGAIGKTGRATGPHLHWGMNWFQVKLDPSLSTRTPAPPRV